MASTLAALPVVQSGHQLALIKRTVAADTNAAEFDLFAEVARRTGLDPIRKQISALVFNKGNPEKRRMAIVTTIDGLRAIAARSRRYRPDEDEPALEYDQALKGDTNPLGLVKATVRIWIADVMRDGGWKPVTGVAYWEEFAPLKEEWAENERTGRREKTGKQTLDTGGNWGRMGRLMLAKCAEAQALRKAFPEDTSGLYETAEFDRAAAEERTASELIELTVVEDRVARIGAANAITFQLSPNESLEPIPLGQVADKVLERLREWSLPQLRWFVSANTHPMREFWSRSPGDALALKAEIEARKAALEAEA